MDITLACSEENMVEVVAKEVYIKMCNNNNNNKLAMQFLSPGGMQGGFIGFWKPPLEQGNQLFMLR